MGRIAKLLLGAEFFVAFLAPTIGLVVLLGAVPAMIIALFEFEVLFVLYGLGLLLLTVAAVYGLWGAWQLLAIQLFPSLTIGRPRALGICLMAGLVALIFVVVLAPSEPWYIRAGLLLPVPVTLHLLVLYFRSNQLGQASDV